MPPCDPSAPSLGPLTVAVCYTGGVGVRAIGLVADRADMRLVGVLVRDRSKSGLDAGSLAGIGPIGLATTTELGDIIAARPDCVIWAGRGWQLDEICTLLRAGVNVYTPVGAWYLPGDVDFDAVERACLAGGVTIVGGGSIPGLVSDVLPLFLTGYVGRVRQIRAYQRNLIGDYPSAEQLRSGLGFGEQVPAHDPESDPRDDRWIRYLTQSTTMIANSLGIELGPLALARKEYATCPQDILLPNGLLIPRGHIAGVRWEFVAQTLGGGPFYTLIKEQVAVSGLGPGWRASKDEPQWRVEIEGTPSLVCELNPVAEGGFGESTAELNAARAVNLVPRIVAAAPGCRSALDFAAPVGAW